MTQLNYLEPGLIDYRECWDRQEELLEQLVRNRSVNKTPTAENYFLLVEHPHVYTLGKSGDPGNMLITEEYLKKIGATFYRINRGGDITYHGPGQLVGYLIMDLEYFHIGIREFIWKMPLSKPSAPSDWREHGGKELPEYGWMSMTLSLSEKFVRLG